MAVFVLGCTVALAPGIALALALSPEFRKVLPHLDWQILEPVARAQGWLLAFFVAGLALAALVERRLPRLRRWAWLWGGLACGASAVLTLFVPQLEVALVVVAPVAIGMITGLCAASPAQVGR